jgi:hypothetical protein
MDLNGIEPVGGPVWVAWREGTLTRAKELEALAAWCRSQNPRDQVLAAAIQAHLDAARQAATTRRRVFRTGPLMERSAGNLAAAEAHILNTAPADYVLGQMPSLLRDIQAHLPATDPGRREFERIAHRVGNDLETAAVSEEEMAGWLRVIDQERGKIVTAVRAASSAALRERIRLRSFRNIVMGTAIAMTLLAVGVALLGLADRSLIPLCFAPEESGTAVVVCPTAQSDRFTPSQDGVGLLEQATAPRQDIDNVVAATAKRGDLLIVELVGLAAATIAGAAAIRRIRGSSERYGLPVALAALKLPTGAITAFLGLLLMRGQFVPGLSALDTSAQILAWALVFGYAQQLFTRLVDQQGQTVLNSIRVPDKPPS